MEVTSVNISDGHMNRIVQALDCDMICFMNPDTCEIEDVPHDFLSGMYHDDAWQEIVDRVDQWKKYITFDRPGFLESVKIMQSFIDEYVPSGMLKEQLNNALELRRPDKTFHRIVESSDYRDQWVTYNRRQMMKHIRMKLRDHMVVEPSLPTVVLR